MNLSSYKGKHRLLLIFASSTSDKKYEEQLRLLEALEPEFEDRNLLLGKFPEHEAGELGRNPVSAADAAEIRGKFGVGPDRFAVLLVGKDGTEKFRTEDPVSAEKSSAASTPCPCAGVRCVGNIFGREFVFLRGR